MAHESVRLYLPGNPKVVAIGGGHGLSTMLRGLFVCWLKSPSLATSPPSSPWQTTAAAPVPCGRSWECWPPATSAIVSWR